MSRNVDNWIQGYVEYTKHLEAPDQFHMWAAIGTIAGALRGKVWLDMGYFRWKPNFFIVLVAPPGVVSKSTTVGVGMEFLREIPEVHFGPDSATWQGITEAFIEAELTAPGVGQHSSLTIAASELGTFLDPRNREMVDVLCDLWDGRNVPWKRRTKGEGLTEIHNPWLNFLGCTTPGWMQENFPVSAIRGGFTSRTIFVYGERKRKLVAYPGLEMAEAGPEFKKLRLCLASDLRTIAGLTGEFKLTARALEWGAAWYSKHNTTPSDLDPEVYGGYIARKQTHIHKTAMVLSAAVRNDLVVTEFELIQADHLVSSLEEEMVEVFMNIGEDKHTQAKNYIIRLMKHHPKGIKKATLLRHSLDRMAPEVFNSLFQALIDANVLQELSRSDGAHVIARPGGIRAQVVSKAVQMLSQEEVLGRAKSVVESSS